MNRLEEKGREVSDAFVRTRRTNKKVEARLTDDTSHQDSQDKES